MKLTDLNPRWIDVEIAGVERKGIGITFDCPGPCCTGLPSFLDKDRPPTNPYRARAGCCFDKPLDGGEPNPGPTWVRTSGDTFETLTLSPSVWISPPEHWHGRIENGEAHAC